MAGLFNTIAKRLRQVAFSFREKPVSKVDDYVLEHFLLYHGLVGSSPENQRSYRDVRQEVIDAVNNGSSMQLAIALKVPPLWWDEKLKKIVDELKDKNRFAELLLPQLDDEAWPSLSDPLGHPEWNVRANAANLIAYLKITSGDVRIIRALNDTVDNGSAAFCHIAYALGKLSTDRGIDALKNLLGTEEPWFRVDVAGSLAATNRENIYESICEALFLDHALQDYTAVAVSKYRKPEQFFQSSNSLVKDGGCALIIGLLQASRQTFNSDLIDEAHLTELLPALIELARSEPNAIRIRAALLLSEWVATAQPHSAPTSQEAAIEIFKTTEMTALILHSLKIESSVRPTWAKCNQRHAAHLVGELGLTKAVPDLVAMLDKIAARIVQNNALELAVEQNWQTAASGAAENDDERTAPPDVVIEALKNLGDASAAKQLVAMANQLVDLNSRISKLPSKNPVAEEDELKAKTYWQILRALGNLPAPNSVTLLTTATSDFAPDKREQALASLISANELNGSLMSKSALLELVRKGIEDQAPGVRVVALDGAGRLDGIELLTLILDAFDAREKSVATQARETLTELWQREHSSKIEAEINTRISKEKDEFKRKRLAEFLAACKSA